jgi:hypothetical protein
MKNIIKGIILGILILLCLPGKALGFGESQARALSLGGAYTTLAKGFEASLWNPANLGIPKGWKSSYNLFSLGARIGNNSISLKDYNSYNGTFLDDNDKEKIISSIPQDGLNLNGDFEGIFPGASYGPFALTTGIMGASNLSISKDPFHLLLFGNSLNEKTTFDGTEGENYILWDVAFSYGRSFSKRGNSAEGGSSSGGKEFFVGGNLKWLKGLFYQKVTKAKGEVLTLATGIEGEGDFALKSATGGYGFSFDLGFASLIGERITIGACFFNLLNNLKWNKGTKEHGYRVIIDSLTAENSDDDSVFLDEDYEKDIGSFNTHLPTIFRAGFSYKLRKATLSLDWEQGFEKRAGSSKTPKISFGSEYHLLNWLPLRGGLTLGGKERFAFSWGSGLDLKPFFIDFGMSIQNAILPYYGKGLALAISSGLKF